MHPAFLPAAPALPRARRGAASPFLGAAVAAAPRARAMRPAARRAVRMEFELSEGEPFKLDLAPLVLGIIGWIVPSSLPAGIPLTDGTGLTQAFFARMNANLAAWPRGPAADDPFWTLMFLWHVGLFACLIFGTIGWNGRKGGTFNS